MATQVWVDEGFEAGTTVEVSDGAKNFAVTATLADVF